MAGGARSRTPSVPSRKRRSIKGLLFAYGMIIIPFGFLLWFAIIPFLIGVSKSFYSYNGGNIDRLNGLDNFVNLIVMEPLFWPSVANGLLLMAVAVTMTTIVPLAAAWMVHHIPSAGYQYFFRIAVMVPVIVPAVVLILVWQQILKPEGVINVVLRALGLGSLAHNWFGDSDVALFGLMLVGLPFLVGINCLLYLGGLASVPRELYEATQLDGAGRWSAFSRVELPYLVPQIRIIVTLGVIGGLQSYEGVLILTQGGPADATVVPGLLLFRSAFSYGQLGYANAIGLMILLITLTVLGLIMFIRKVSTRG